ncbi:17817_t:CDS:2, partial [Dentiscutata erythropus]
LRIYRKNGKEEQEKNNSKVRRIEVWKLLGDQFMDLFIMVKARTTNQIPNNISIDRRIDTTIQKLLELSELLEQLKDASYEYHENLDERLLYPEDKKYFCETFDITGVCLVFVNYSGMVVMMLDSQNICAIVESTGKLIPIKELEAHIEKQDLAKPIK